MPLVELFYQFGIEFQGVETDGIGHSGEIGKAHQEKQISAIAVFPVDLVSIWGKEYSLVDIPSGAEPAANAPPPPIRGRVSWWRLVHRTSTLTPQADASHPGLESTDLVARSSWLAARLP